LAFSQQIGWIGVDVGTHTVKLAQAVHGAGAVRLHRAAVIQRPTSWSADDALALEQPVTSYPEIQAALEGGGFIGRDAVCSLSMNVCQLRALNVPPGSDRERRTIIADELAEDWAECRQPMEFDFWELDSGRPENAADGFNVSVLAVSRHWIDQLRRDCRQSGLDCWAIDGTPLAIARAVGLAGGFSGGHRVLAVDWGYANTLLCVVGDHRPLYSRRIHDCAFGLVVEAIVNAFDVTIDEAQHLAEAQGLAATKTDGDRPADESAEALSASVPDPRIQAAISDAAAAPIRELVRQIARTLDFMAAQRRQLHPAAIWLLGGGATMRNAAPCLEQALGLPVNVWNLPSGRTIRCAAGHRSALFGAAVALSASTWRAA
jgi:type IV pilus assembly protein PilM